LNDRTTRAASDARSTEELAKKIKESN